MESELYQWLGPTAFSALGCIHVWWPQTNARHVMGIELVFPADSGTTGMELRALSQCYR